VFKPELQGYYTPFGFFPPSIYLPYKLFWGERKREDGQHRKKRKGFSNFYLLDISGIFYHYKIVLSSFRHGKRKREKGKEEEKDEK